MLPENALSYKGLSIDYLNDNVTVTWTKPKVNYRILYLPSEIVA